MTKKASMLIFLILLVSISTVSSETVRYEVEQGTLISSGSEHVVELGVIQQGNWIDVFHDSDEVPIDVTIMSKSNWNSFDESIPLTNATELSSTYSVFRWQVEQTDEYVIIFDNSGRFSGGAEGLTDAILESDFLSYGGKASVTDTSFHDFETRLYIEPGDMFRYDFGVAAPGSYLRLSVSLEEWLSESIDVFVVQNENLDSFLSGEDTWDRNATFFDVELGIWYFEPVTVSTWHVFIENGPRGESPEMIEDAVVDVEFDIKAKTEYDIIQTSRMVESGEVWHGELGSRSAGTVLDFSLVLEGFTSEIDVLILNTTEANRFLAGENVTVLGHASLINTDSWDTWSYTFPESGTYSILLDNTNSPVGGGAETRPIHAEIEVDEATLSSSWLGWYKSRHYVEEDSYFSFNLGELFVGDEIYYSISGANFGTSFFPGFDVALMTNDQYLQLVEGNVPEIIEDASDIDTWYASLTSYEITTRGEYYLVVETGDLIPEGSSDPGAWTMDFTIKSLGSVELVQAMDQNYLLTATHHTKHTNSGTSNPSDETSNPNGDNQGNIGDTQGQDNLGGDSFGGSMVGICAVCCIVPILGIIFVVRGRKKKANMHMNLAIQQGVQQAFSNQQQQPVMGDNYATAGGPMNMAPPLAHQFSMPITVASYLELAGGGNYNTLQDGRLAYNVNGETWIQNPDGSFTKI